MIEAMTGEGLFHHRRFTLMLAENKTFTKNNRNFVMVNNTSKKSVIVNPKF